MAERLIYLRGGGVSVVLTLRGDSLPAVLHWGVDLGEAPPDSLPELLQPVVAHSALDKPAPVGLLPEPAAGYAGRSGLQVLRADRGATWSPAFRHVRAEPAADGSTVIVEASDADLEVALHSELALEQPSGLLRLRHSVTNTGTTALWVVALHAALPVPVYAAEVLDLTGRWSRERSPERRPFHDGAVVRETRRGRTGHDASLVMAAGTTGFGFETGELWAVHVAWSGDCVSYAERLPEGHAMLGGGELLGPGEIELAPGETYESPLLLAAWSGAGLNGAAARWHDWLRARPSHPRRVRPVVLNTWEAVFFDHDLTRLRQLAKCAAHVGVERFVLDDGWFRGRRDDARALGDWTADVDRWPQGLHPPVDQVRELGMEFGPWVEPEMVNPDSDLARKHPDWVLRGRGELPPSWRHQQVLDLAHPEAFAFIKAALLTLIDEYDIAFLKWDHNRDLVDVAHAGRPAVHAQTQAFYALLDQLRVAYPSLEIETCASGGARVDLEVLQRTQRVWASDCIDPLERWRIQRWTGLLVPPEMVGSHVGAATSHITGRTHTLGFRAATAFFGHFGIEWDIARAGADEIAELTGWIALHKQERALLHTGRVVVTDTTDPATAVHGVVAVDGLSAIFAVASLTTSARAVPAPVRLPGFDPERSYRLERLGPVPTYGSITAGWLGSGPVQASGLVLTRIGVALPVLRPETAVLLKVTAIS